MSTIVGCAAGSHEQKRAAHDDRDRVTAFDRLVFFAGVTETLRKPAPFSSPIKQVGLDAAGKTTILYKLKLGEIVTTIPTIGKWREHDLAFTRRFTR